MKDILLFLLKNIVSNPKDITIDESTGENGQSMLTAHVHKDDMGLVIGKQGRIIRAIRDLVKLVAAKQNAFVDVILAEETP